MDRRFSDYGLQRDESGMDFDGSRRSFPIRILAVIIPLSAVLYLVISRFFHAGTDGANGQDQARNTLKGMNLASVVSVGLYGNRDKKSESGSEKETIDSALQTRLSRAGTAAAEGRLDEAVDLYRGCLKQSDLSADVRRLIERRASDVMLKKLLSTEADSGKVAYTVASGDTLDKIARKFGTITACILQMNGLRDTRLRIGQKLTILDKPFFEWQQPDNSSLVLYCNGEFLKRYEVSPDGKGDTRLWISLPEGRRLFALRNVSDAAEIRLFIR